MGDGDRSVAQPAPQVRVTNRNEFDIEDRHDGVPYEFPGRTYAKDDVNKEKPIYKPVTIPPDAAAHIFGYGLFGDLPPKEQLRALFDHIIKRFGWNVRENEGRAREWFRNLEIRPVMYVIQEVSQDEEGARGQRGKTA